VESGEKAREMGFSEREKFVIVFFGAIFPPESAY